MHIAGISGSPGERSRSVWLTQFALTCLEGAATRTDRIAVRGLPVAALRTTGGSAAHRLALDHAL